MSSSAQPVTAIDPVTPVALSDGVSIAPVGAADAPTAIVVRFTVIGPAALLAPVRDKLTAPALAPEIGSALLDTAPIVSVAGKLVPDEGETVIHGWVAVADHDTVPNPVCRILTVWFVVTCANDPPEFVAPKFTTERSSETVGPTAAGPAIRGLVKTSGSA